MARLVRSDPAACAAYWELLCLRMEGDLDVETLRRALQVVVGRHDALRTRLAPGAFQEVLASIEVNLPLCEAGGEAAVAEWWRAIAEAPTELERGPLFRFALARTAPGEHLLAFCTHHLVSDGWSIGVLLREVGAVYGALREGSAPSLARPMQFGAWAAEAGRLHAAQAEAHLAYWEGVARGLAPAEPPRRGSAGEFRGARRSLELDGARVGRLRAEGARRGRTLFMTLFGAFTHLLHELCGSAGVVACVSSAGRGVPGCEGTVGDLAQVLPVVSRRAASLDASVEGASRSLLELYAHQDYPFALARAHLARLGLPVPEPVAAFNLDPIAGEPSFAGLRVQVVPRPVSFVRRALSFNLLPAPGGALLLDCDYAAGALTPSEIEGATARFIALLEELAGG